MRDVTETNRREGLNSADFLPGSRLPGECALAAQLEMILRQVTEPRMKFMLVVRTPPDLALTTYPVLAASIFEPAAHDPGVSFRLAPWRHEQACQVWESAEGEHQTPFTDLPPSVQQLATVPLYLALLHSAGRAGPERAASAYRLVDHCIRGILRRAGVDAAVTFESLSDLAMAQAPILLARHSLRTCCGGPRRAVRDQAPSGH
ncbi:hypothetical protein [Dactylosporangium sp. NPDC006015]|uniref:hypothetical protein n=1 Tax=Dactylosporangium sp. NPDC006015 TaxID=3154576 RepID=UPI0033A1D8B4